MKLRWLFVLLLLVFALLQYRLWFAQGSLAEQHRLRNQAREQTEINDRLNQRNEVLEREVIELQNGVEGIERRAREDLGLVKEGEVFFHVVDEHDKAAPDKK